MEKLDKIIKRERSTPEKNYRRLRSQQRGQGYLSRTLSGF